MFGFKALKREIDYVSLNMITRCVAEDFITDIKKQGKIQESDLKRLNTLLTDLKSLMGSLKDKVGEMCKNVTPYSDTIDTLLTYTHSVDRLSEFIEKNVNENQELKRSMNQMLEHQKRMIDFMETQDKINQDLIAVIETYGPIKKVPKLPKTKTATIVRS